MIDPVVSGAVVTGLLGSGHCLGMCGVITGALGLCGPRAGGLWGQLLYNAGRVLAYALIGCLVGWLGLSVARAEVLRGGGRAVLVGGDLFAILVGLAGAANLGGVDWLFTGAFSPLRVLKAAVRALGNLPPALAALPMGFVLGFIPCGFLYSVVLIAALTASPLEAARVMTGFGVGTAPALLAFGSAAGLLGTRSRSWMLRAAGVCVALMGAYNLGRHLQVPACCP